MFEINSYEDFYKLEEIVNSDIDPYVNVELKSDITFPSGAHFPSIGTDYYPYMGTLVGNKHTITFNNGHYMTGGRYTEGFFSHIGYGGMIYGVKIVGLLTGKNFIQHMSGGTIKNCVSHLKFKEDPKIYSQNFGGFCENASFSKFIHCINRSVLDKSNIKGFRIPEINRMSSIINYGGICAVSNKCKFEKCKNFSDFTIQLDYCDNFTLHSWGGITGSDEHHSYFKECENHGSFLVDNDVNSYVEAVGGIIGRMEVDKTEEEKKHVFSDGCINYGNINLPQNQSKLYEGYRGRRTKYTRTMTSVGAIFGKTNDYIGDGPKFTDANFHGSKNTGVISAGTDDINMIGTRDPSQIKYYKDKHPIQFIITSHDTAKIKKACEYIKDPNHIDDDGNNLLISLCREYAYGEWDINPNDFNEIVALMAKNGVEFGYINESAPEREKSPISFLYDQNGKVLKGMNNTVKIIKSQIQEEHIMNCEDESESFFDPSAF